MKLREWLGVIATGVAGFALWQVGTILLRLSVGDIPSEATLERCLIDSACWLGSTADLPALGAWIFLAVVVRLMFGLFPPASARQAVGAVAPLILVAFAAPAGYHVMRGSVAFAFAQGGLIAALVGAVAAGVYRVMCSGSGAQPADSNARFS